MVGQGFTLERRKGSKFSADLQRDGNPALDKRAARSLLCASGFPVRPQIFPALAAREFCSQAIEFPLESRGASVILSQSRRISLYFPVEQGTSGRRRVRRLLPPPNHIIFIELFCLGAFQPPDRLRQTPQGANAQGLALGLGRGICRPSGDSPILDHSRQSPQVLAAEFDLAQGRRAVPEATMRSNENTRRKAGGGYVKLKIAMANANATAPSVRADGPDDAEARRGHQRGTPRGWWVSLA